MRWEGGRESGNIEDRRSGGMQMQARGHVTPESFSHGSSEQRARWFRRGLDSGQFAQCNTFQTRNL